VDAAGLRKSFGSVRAVESVDLRVRPGEIVAFLGPNGAGKTTTIDMLLGLSDPDAARCACSARARARRSRTASSRRCCRPAAC
jgi:ABC-type multidrug transport system ATPase subunit